LLRRLSRIEEKFMTHSHRVVFAAVLFDAEHEE